MSKALMVLAPGFEEIEALGVIDVLRRLGIDVVPAGLEALDVSGAHGIAVRCDARLEDCAERDFDAVILPGGMAPGAARLLESERVLELLKQFSASGRTVAAICAAPIVLAKAGLLAGRRFTMYPGLESYLGGLIPTAAPTEHDGHLVTGRGPGAFFGFALAIAADLGVPRARLDEVAAAMFMPAL